MPNIENLMILKRQVVPYGPCPQQHNIGSYRAFQIALDLPVKSSKCKFEKDDKRT